MGVPSGGLAAHDPREFYAYTKPIRVRGGSPGWSESARWAFLAAETTLALEDESRILSRACDARRYER
jgi:hypothetical protein